MDTIAKNRKKAPTISLEGWNPAHPKPINRGDVQNANELGLAAQYPGSAWKQAKGGSKKYININHSPGQPTEVSYRKGMDAGVAYRTGGTFNTEAGLRKASKGGFIQYSTMGNKIIGISYVIQPVDANAMVNAFDRLQVIYKPMTSKADSFVTVRVVAWGREFDIKRNRFLGETHASTFISQQLLIDIDEAQIRDIFGDDGTAVSESTVIMILDYAVITVSFN